jgi:hypothetical protein
MSIYHNNKMALRTTQLEYHDTPPISLCGYSPSRFGPETFQNHFYKPRARNKIRIPKYNEILLSWCMSALQYRIIAMSHNDAPYLFEAQFS